MTEMIGKKALSLCILRILEGYASKDAPLSTREIITHLQEEYGLEAERKAVGRNLVLLGEMGFPLSTYQQNGRGYYLTSETQAQVQKAAPVLPKAEDLTDAERAVLLDAVLRAPDSELIERARQRLQTPQAPIYAEPPVALRSDERLLRNLSLLKQAIGEKRQLSFLYNNRRADGTLTPQRSTPFVASPYALFFAEGLYYVIVAISGYGRALHYRCDLMSELTLLDEPARDAAELSDFEAGMDVHSYVLRNFYGQRDAERFTLLCARHLVGELFERFGEGLTITEAGDNLQVETDAPWTRVKDFVLCNLRYVVLLEPLSRRKLLTDELSYALRSLPQA